MLSNENLAGVEWQLLEKISIADPGTDEFSAAVELAGSIADPDELFTQAARHTLLPTLGYFLTQAELLPILPHQMRHTLLAVLQWNRGMTNSYIAETARITDALGERGLRAAVTKGVVGQASLYDGHGTRQFNDVDLMILPEERTEVAATLFELGYAGAKLFDYRTGEFVNMARSVTAMYRLYPDHLPHFLRLNPDPSLPYYSVDVAFSLTWFGSEWQVPMEDVIGSIVRVPVRAGETDTTLPTLDAPYFFLFTVLHLFREGWFSRVLHENDARLSQTADVWRCWRRLARHRISDISAVIDATGIAPAVAWVCHHVDQVYGSTMVPELGLEGFVDPDWLRSASSVDGDPQAWHGDFRRRLRERGAPKLTAAAEPIYATSARGS